MINFNTDNIVLLLYTAGSGGKFLANCLGLSNDAVLQSERFANLQLNGHCDTLYKWNYIKTQLETATTWTDLGLGCSQLYGLHEKNYDISNKHDLKFNGVIEKLSNSNYKFFLMSHSPDTFKKFLNIWPNAKTIIFLNPQKFLEYRFGTFNYPFNWDNLERIPKAFHYFDNDIYLNVDKTINEIKLLYDKLNLSNYNENFIQTYYNMWIEKIVEVNENSK
jgi:hypothetical protein